MTNGNGTNESRLDRVERILESVALRQDAISEQQQILTQQLLQTRAIADSNARAIEALTNHTAEARDLAEEERSELRVGLNELRVGMEELRQESRENIAQHLTFRGEIQDLRDRIDRE